MESARIISPLGNIRVLEREMPFGRERFNTWWNERLLDEGEWEIHLQDKFGKTYIHSFTIDKSLFLNRTELVYPIEWEEVDTPSPEVEFAIFDDVDRVHFRVYDVIDRHAPLLEDRVDLQSRRVLQIDKKQVISEFHRAFCKAEKHMLGRCM